MRVFQKGFNYSQDGDGNRLVYHLQGCNMHCPWCANPEGMRPEGVIVADEEWLLEGICPYGAIRDGVVDRTTCGSCQRCECITEHDTKGMYLSYEEQSVDAMEREILSNAMMFYDGGGVTFTGGEATLQFAQLKELLQRLKDDGIHTAIETNGTHPRLPELFPFVDQLIMDCKLVDPKKHLEYTGVPAEIVLENLRRAAREHPYLHVRVPLIGGVNAGVSDREQFLEFFRTIKGDNVSFETLAYHEFGKKKWRQCGWEYRMGADAFVSDAVRRTWIEAIKKAGCTYKKS